MPAEERPPGRTGAPVVLPKQQWTVLARRHEDRVRPWVQPRLQRRAAGLKHPVDDFLFEYYGYSPGKLQRWQPGWGVVLADAGAEFGTRAGFVGQGGSVRVDPLIRDRLAARAATTHELLKATAQRSPALGCFALHEWAMVYRTDASQLRHSGWPLRLGHSGTDAVVERLGLRCTHFDAFRFFAPEARPLNPEQLTRTDQIRMEQPGCLHATMDLYRAAYRLSPVIGSDLIADCFALARAGRVLDMRSSPYDLAGLGLDPIPVETADGRADFLRQQRELAAAGQHLRGRLLEAIRQAWPPDRPSGR